MIGEWVYLGDGVYVKFDGYGYILHANSHEHPTDRIYIEPEVLERFKAYVAKEENRHREQA